MANHYCPNCGRLAIPTTAGLMCGHCLRTKAETYNDGLEAAAQWHEMEAAVLEERRKNKSESALFPVWGQIMHTHRSDAAAIRALKEPED